MTTWQALWSTLPLIISLAGAAAQGGTCTDPSKSFQGGALLQRGHAWTEPAQRSTSALYGLSEQIAAAANGSPQTRRRLLNKNFPRHQELPTEMPANELVKWTPAKQLPYQRERFLDHGKIPFRIDGDGRPSRPDQAREGDDHPGSTQDQIRHYNTGPSIQQTLPTSKYTEVAAHKAGDLSKKGYGKATHGTNESHLSTREGKSHKDTTTLFYHFHIPRTGGTSIANLIVSNICNPFHPEPVELKWENACSEVCNQGLTDNEFVCNPGRDEHATLAPSIIRAKALAVDLGAVETVYVTSLRRGSDRLLSEWLFSMNYGSWLPQTTANAISNESLQEYIGMLGDPFVTWPGANLQVAYLASVNLDAKTIDDGDLEVAKQALLTGSWIIGFADCMDQMNGRLYEVSTQLHHGLAGLPRTVPHISQGWNTGSLYEGADGTDHVSGLSKSRSIQLSPEVSLQLDWAARFDNHLFAWALNKADEGVDPRFTKACKK